MLFCCRYRLLLNQLHTATLHGMSAVNKSDRPMDPEPRVNSLQMNPMATEQPQPMEKRKRKRRGNRELQRYRAKLRKEGLTDVAIKQLLDDERNLEIEQEEVIVTDEFNEIQMLVTDQVRQTNASHVYHDSISIGRGKQRTRASERQQTKTRGANSSYNDTQ